MAGGYGRIEEIAEDGVRPLFTVAPADPAAGAGLVVAGGGFVPVVGWIAQANDDGDDALDLERLGVLLGDGPQEERQLRRLGVGAFERVG